MYWFAVRRLLQEQEAWTQLLAQYNAMTSRTAGAAEGAAGNPSVPGAASPQKHQQDAEGAEAAAGAGAENPADQTVPVTRYC